MELAAPEHCCPSGTSAVEGDQISAWPSTPRRLSEGQGHHGGLPGGSSQPRGCAQLPPQAGAKASALRVSGLDSTGQESSRGGPAPPPCPPTLLLWKWTVLCVGEDSCTGRSGGRRQDGISQQPGMGAEGGPPHTKAFHAPVLWAPGACWPLSSSRWGVLAVAPVPCTPIFPLPPNLYVCVCVSAHTRVHM